MWLVNGCTLIVRAITKHMFAYKLWKMSNILITMGCMYVCILFNDPLERKWRRQHYRWLGFWSARMAFEHAQGWVFMTRGLRTPPPPLVAFNDKQGVYRGPYLNRILTWWHIKKCFIQRLVCGTGTFYIHVWVIQQGTWLTRDRTPLTISIVKLERKGDAANTIAR